MSRPPLLPELDENVGMAFPEAVFNWAQLGSSVRYKSGIYTGPVSVSSRLGWLSIECNTCYGIQPQQVFRRSGVLIAGESTRVCICLMDYNQQIHLANKSATATALLLQVVQVFLA